MKFNFTHSSTIKLFQIAVILIFTLNSCQGNKWKKIEIISPDKNDTISIITTDNKRYIYNGSSSKIPKDNLAIVDISSVSELGDEIGICWNKDDFKWKLNSFDAKLETTSLNEQLFKVQNNKIFDDQGTPNYNEYFKNNCVVIFPKGGIVRPENGAELRYK